MKNLKKILILLTWIFILAYLVISPFMISNKIDSIICSELEINIKNDYEGHSFVTKDEILKTLQKKGIKLIGQPIDSIRETYIEKYLSNISFIKKADIYVSVKGTVKIDITQRIPILRIINNRNQNFYLDNYGNYIPLSRNYTAHVITITGHFSKPTSSSLSVTEEGILKMVKYIM